MKFLFFVIVSILGVANATADQEKDHNDAEHKALCAVMQAAVEKWGSSGEGLSDTLKKALGRTLFGNEEGKGNVESLRGNLPADYEKVNDVLLPRYYWCGERHKEGESSRVKPPRRSGHSAPHDLLCLCTAGNGGWPVNNGNGKLCGQSKHTLEGHTEGWSSSGADKGKVQVTEAWTKVVAPCLQKREAGENLRGALETFKHKIDKTIHNEGRNGYLLGEGNSGGYPCSGNGQACVIYYNQTDNIGHTYPMPWWTGLEEAIQKEEAEKEEKKKEEEGRKQANEQRQRRTQNQEKSKIAHEPRTADLKQATPDKQDAEQTNHENISSPLATLEDTSGTPISLPCPWLLSALLFI
ncbi:Variant surface glycoprotein [Trypanosoma congolense IL3000]|uniref:Variant surface glycoprotein n=1 Tax=Trypanosoma congolense (strain IL3000) TaxID=1068625 RepID=F9WEM1_TRYCI|nr:Variant surface glycoprotein [Trypanosoma congolense IL3000]